MRNGGLVVEVGLAQPPGTRSCGTGGEWQCCRAPGKHNTNYWLAEYEALRRQCSRADSVLIMTELRDRMREAELGRHTCGPHGSIDHMDADELILEIRVRSKPKFPDGDKRVLRLYFSEPAHEPGMLLAAMLAWKPDKPGRAIQDKQIVEAGQRVRDYFA